MLGLLVVHNGTIFFLQEQKLSNVIQCSNLFEYPKETTGPVQTTARVIELV